ncbi:condensation protein [Gordonia sp. X0973]|uniref:condensation protein n=1 Tax=Gordonia sp. X0973 TaxID=2742602 RepID=UPI000F524FEB|nr:condensation protein [Gordonia sp. X0973]QKT06779.1 condensation protein [Gordonia sp. X0973]
MDFLQILDLPIEPGGLVEWTPVLDGRKGLRLDPRPTSFNHEQHLSDALAYQAQTGHTGGRESWLGLSIEFDEPLSIPAIRAALTAWIDRHEVLRTHVVEADDSDAGAAPEVGAQRFRRFSAEPGAVSVKMSRVGWYHDPTLLLDQIAGWFDRSTAPVRWPAYCFATVGREDSFTLLFAGDHSLLDGYSLIAAVPELRALYRQAVVAAGRPARGHAPPLLPAESIGSYVDFSAAERAAAEQSRATDPAVDTWAEFLADGMPRYPTVAGSAAASPTASAAAGHPTARENDRRAEQPRGFAVGGYAEGSEAAADATPQISYYALLADDDTANEFTAVCSGAGATLFAGVMASLAYAAHRRTGVRRFRAILPRHTRHEPRWLAAVGWFVTLSPFDLEVSGAESFTELAVRASAELRRGRAAATQPLLRVAQLLGTSGAPQFVVSFLDTRSAPGAPHDDSGGARVLRSHRYADDEVYLWINRTPSGLRLSARYPRRLDEDVHTYVADVTALIAQVAETSSWHARGLV